MSDRVPLDIEIKNDLTKVLPIAQVKDIKTGLAQYLFLSKPHELQISGSAQHALSFFGHKDCDFNIVKQKASTLAQSLIYSKMSSQLISYIERADVPKAQASSNWFDLLLPSRLGPVNIYRDLYMLMDSMQIKLGEGLSNLSNLSQNMTLMVPSSHYPYLMAKDDTDCSVLDMLKKTFPELNAVTIPELNTGKKSYVVLTYNSPSFGNAGYFAWNGSDQNQAYLSTHNDSDPTTDFIEYSLGLPEYQLTIIKPKQIAILEGI